MRWNTAIDSGQQQGAPGQTRSGALPISHQMGTLSSFPGVKRQRREGGHLLSSRAEVKHAIMLTERCSGAEQRKNFSFITDLSLRSPRFNAGSFHVEFAVDRHFSKYCRFPLSHNSTIPFIHSLIIRNLSN